ncbi:hypothetical protein [Methylobacterium fujisawaense]
MRKSNTAQAVKPASDLRQRAARARDAAGRFIRRSTPGDASATATAAQDPALAVTALFGATWEALGKALDAEVPDELIEDLQAAEGAAFDRLRAVRPTSPAGFRALADTWSKVLEDERGGEPGLMLADQAADSLIAGAGACVPVNLANAVPPHPDAALFDLGAEFVAAWAVEEETSDGAGYWACNRVAQQIVQTPAATAVGLGIKALLLARLDEDDSSPRNPVAAQGPIASHWNVLRQIQEGAARLAAGQAASATPSASVKPDLSALTVVELARLYPVLVRAEVALGSAGESPCFLQNNRTERTNAGRIINWEVDRLQRFSSAVAAEVSRRQPDDRGDQAERANTLLTHMVLTGGVEEHPELISEICATWGSAR